jgi:hypothetical protein
VFARPPPQIWWVWVGLGGRVDVGVGVGVFVLVLVEVFVVRLKLLCGGHACFDTGQWLPMNSYEGATYLKLRFSSAALLMALFFRRVATIARLGP